MNVAIPQVHLERKVSRSSITRVPLVGALHPSSVRAIQMTGLNKDEKQRTKSRQSMELRVSVIGFSNAIHENHLSTHPVMQL